MDDLVNLSLRSSQDADLQSRLSEALVKAGKKHAGSVDKVLGEVLHPFHHGVAYAELLSYKLQSATPPNEVKNVSEFIEQARVLALHIPAQQLPFCAKAITHISRQLTKTLLATEKGMRGIGALKALVEKITIASPSVLTSIHVDLLLLVLKCHAYDLVSDLSFLHSSAATLGTAILSIDPPMWPIGVDDYLQFWLYIGNYFAARKMFVESQEAYNMALTMPSQGAVSAIQVEAYKKYVLVSLLAQGMVTPLNPRLTAPIVLRHLDTLSAPYLDLSKAYHQSSSLSISGSHGSVSELIRLTESHADVFLADRNLGLIKQIIKRIVKKQITKLTQTYITYGLADIATQVNLVPAATSAQQPPQPPPAQIAERYVFDMICANEVFAKLNSQASMVQFLDDPEEYDTTPFIDAMDARIGDVAALSEKLSEVEKRLQLTPAYLIKSGHVGGGRGGGGGGDDMAYARALSAQEQYDAGGYDREDDELKRAMEASLMHQ